MIKRILAILAKRILAILLGIDITVYALITLGDCNWRESLSGAAYRTEKRGKVAGIVFRPLIDFLAWPFEREHCRKTHEKELKMGIAK